MDHSVSILQLCHSTSSGVRPVTLLIPVYWICPDYNSCEVHGIIMPYAIETHVHWPMNRIFEANEIYIPLPIECRLPGQYNIDYQAYIF